MSPVALHLYKSFPISDSLNLPKGGLDLFFNLILFFPKRLQIAFPQHIIERRRKKLMLNRFYTWKCSTLENFKKVSNVSSVLPVKNV